MKLDRAFFDRSCLSVAPELVGKVLVRRLPDAQELRLRISETEAYRGQEDTACHAHKGKTARTEVLYMESGTIYVYLCYGIHWLLNIVTGPVDFPEAVLIRACVQADGPGKLTRRLEIDKSFNRQNICSCPQLWLEDDGCRFEIEQLTRVGIDYAAPEDRARLWRFKMGSPLNT